MRGWRSIGAVFGKSVRVDVGRIYRLLRLSGVLHMSIGSISFCDCEFRDACGSPRSRIVGISLANLCQGVQAKFVLCRLGWELQVQQAAS